jgi:FixJ family two-component response regulator
MTLAHRFVYAIDDDMSTRKAIGRFLESEDDSVEIFTGLGSFLLEFPTPVLNASFRI